MINVESLEQRVADLEMALSLLTAMVEGLLSKKTDEVSEQKDSIGE
jgi:hypothetical protein